MDVVKTIRPGQQGSRRFLDEWGERLVAVRYRKTSDGSKLFTTIEVIVDEREYQKGVNNQALEAARRSEPVALRIRWQETGLREKVKAAGARWSPLMKLWLLRRDNAVTLGLSDRIVEGAAEQCVDIDTSIQI